jgi:hypothetical protein
VLLEQIWEAVARGEPVDLDELFDGFVTSCDFPACLLFKEMAERWPNAKVVHTVRDPAAWQKSALDTIYFSRRLLHESFGHSVLVPINDFLMPTMMRFNRWTDKLIWDGVFFRGGKVQSLEGEAGLALIKQRMAEWDAAVKKAIPADRLLIYRIEEGWEPLCKFLGKPVPNKPFPRVNDTAEFQKRSRFLFIVWHGVPLVALSLLGGLAYGAWRYFGGI